MLIRTLVENTSDADQLKPEHGLSLYVETKNHKLLFDLGASEVFVENAAQMGVDLSAVDLAVISHGHYDHGGGLKAFFNLNSQAPIYILRQAFEQHFGNLPNDQKIYIGLDETLKDNDRLIFAGDYLRIDDELELFSGVKGRRFFPSGNKDLLMMPDSAYVEDDFVHEQNLIIQEDGKSVLLAGCAHNGIVNIADHFYDLKKIFPSFIIGGFHLYNPPRNESEDPAIVSQIAEYLKATKSMNYTCHCTGMESYNRLKMALGGQIEYLATGSQLII